MWFEEHSLPSSLLNVLYQEVMTSVNDCHLTLVYRVSSNARHLINWSRGLTPSLIVFRRSGIHSVCMVFQNQSPCSAYMWPILRIVHIAVFDRGIWSTESWWYPTHVVYVMPRALMFFVIVLSTYVKNHFVLLQTDSMCPLSLRSGTFHPARRVTLLVSCIPAPNSARSCIREFFSTVNNNAFIWRPPLFDISR